MKTKQYRVYFGRKLEWQKCVDAESREDAKAQVQSFMKTYDIKGKIKVKGDNRND
jgi:hypothetical protein